MSAAADPPGTSVQFEASGLAKSFKRRRIFQDIEFRLTRGESLGVTGRNGSGKSTLLKILAGVLSPSRGEVALRLDGAPVADRFAHLGFVSPYLQLYDELSGWENLDFARRVRKLTVADDALSRLLERVNLYGVRNELVRSYSSGMKQRLKYAFALIHTPPLLLLDEPTSNLDREGTGTVHELMAEQVSRGILVVASNDAEDLTRCEDLIDLDNRPAVKM